MFVDFCRNFSPGQCAFFLSSLNVFALLCLILTLSMYCCSLFLSVVNSLYSSPPGSRHPFLQRFLLDTVQAFSFPPFSLLLSSFISVCLCMLLRFLEMNYFRDEDST